MSFPCSYSPLSEINHVQSSAIHAPKNFQDTSTRIKFERYMSKPLHELSYKKFWNIMNASFPSFDIIDLKIKYDNRNQMCGLKEIFVLPSSKLTAGSETLRSYFACEKRNNAHMNHKESNGQFSISDHNNWHRYPPSILFRLFL